MQMYSCLQSDTGVGNSVGNSVVDVLIYLMFFESLNVLKQLVVVI